jgi:hypothetical protein
VSFARQWLHRLIVLVVFASAGAVASPAQALPEDFGLPKFQYSAFYVPPAPLPAGQPGDIIRAERLDFSHAVTRPPAGTIGWRVMYRSTSATAAPIAVTGTVLLRTDVTPAQGAAQRPIVAYGNEAQGLGDNCAVSRLLVHGHTGEIALWQDLLKAGYAVASTDFEGLGTPDVHTFGVTASGARNMLDMLRAARNLDAAQLPKDGPLGLFGYSQGGAAAGFAAEIAATYAPELKITAAAFGGAPINPISVSRYANGSFFSSVNFGASVGYDAAYPELDLDSFLNEKGQALKKKIYGACIEMIFPLAFKNNAGTLRPGKDPLTDPRWKVRFAENTLGQSAPQFPIYYYHAQLDQASPVRDARTLRRAYCAGKSPLRYLEIPAMEHVATGPVWVPQSAKWLRARFEGKPDAGNCGKGMILGFLTEQ